MSFATAFAEPYYTGTATTTSVPYQWDVALNGRGYLIDLASNAYQRESVALLRNQADTADTTGENSLNPEELWKRAQETWHHGAGQSHLDRDDADPMRFSTSKGVNVWDRYELRLLNKATVSRATGTGLIVAGTRLYVQDGNSLLFTTDLAAYTTVTGTPAEVLASIASDGFTVYAAYAGSGVYTTNRTTGAAAAFNALANVDVLGVVKGRVMAAVDNILYNITASGAAPAALYTHGNADFRWVGFAAGPTHIYAAGFSGDKSLVYKTTIKPDGTALDIPTVATELPDGEVVRSIQGYVGGLMLIGTDLGVRTASIDGDGNLNVGALVRTASPVLCLEPQDRFVWYGLTNFDSASTGLGRLDLSVFTNPLVPAYASDLMATGQGSVASVATFNQRRVFAVTGLGVWAERDELVETGYLRTGNIGYGIADPKVAIYLDLRHEPLVGSIDGALGYDDSATYTALGSSAETGSTSPEQALSARQISANVFEVQVTLNRQSVSAGPVLHRVTLRSYPTPSRTDVFTVPVLLHDRVDCNDSDVTVDPLEELDFLIELRKGQRLVTYQEGEQSYTVFVTDTRWIPAHKTQDKKFWCGTCVLRLKQIAG